MLDTILLAEMTSGYSDEKLQAIAKGFCPKCSPYNIRYRILETCYSEKQGMDVHRVKCSNIVQCDWDESIPAARVDNGLEGFFEL